MQLSHRSGRHLRHHLGLLPLSLAALLCVAIAPTSADDGDKLPPPAKRAIDFAKDVQPLFAKHCYECHGPKKQKSGYRLDDRDVALRGGDIGGAIKPGDSGKSAMLQYVAGLKEDLKMPPKGEALSAEQIGILRAWIEQGADWPQPADDKAGDKAKLWSLRTLAKPNVPPVKQTGWARTPIDAFILAKLESTGLAPSAPADRRTLLRRVTFDLTGLPPTPLEIEAFLKDDSPQAYEKVVDRLLASPRYGERWARHWMDVVHFAETHGHDEDKPRPNAWPYRDYLIRSFNDDTPYARFVQEQVAGDVLFAGDPRAVAALGLVAAGPWDQSSQMGIQDGTIDKQVARYLDRDDMLATVMNTFTSMTVQCARCHNHKFDPISIKDYYALQAVFAGVDRTNRPYDAEPKASARRRELLQRKSDLEGRRVPKEELLGAAVQARVIQWEKSLGTQPVWKVVAPASAASAGGATLTPQPDGSILSGGKRPEKDTYTITLRPGLKRITALRVEVMTDDSLFKKGPGRQDNGNLHLSEFKLLAQPAGAEGAPQAVPVRGAVADFNQDGWTIAHALDGNIATAWGIYPQVGQPHHAIFELKTQLENAEETTLTVLLEQLHGGGHLIGRPRLSATDATQPQQARQVPDAIAAIVATPVQQRNEPQRLDLTLHVLKQANAAELESLPPPAMVYAIASDFPRDGNFVPAVKPRAVSVLRRGDIHQPTEPASPGALSSVEGLEPRFKLSNLDDEGARRAAMAKWLSDPGNVLTWRSIVNRVWHYHFGEGIVDTPNDLGRMGGTPSHPELLDWLAVSFRDDMHGSLKQLHKMIVTSAAYRQACGEKGQGEKGQGPRAKGLELPPPSALGPSSLGPSAIDADNRLLWRMNRRRLDAEQVRDAVLIISGKLDLTMGGPSVKQFIEKPGVHVTPVVDYASFDPDQPANYRRAVYRFVFRTVPDPLMDALDCPDLSQLSPKRNASVTTQQALEMLNNRFLVRQYEHIASRLMNEEKDPLSRVRRLYELAIGRPTTDEELQSVAAYAEKHGLANAVRVVLNSNAFMFVE